MRKFFAAAMAIGLLAPFGLTASAADVEDGFVSLFNGRDLAGWVKRGGSAEYQVENGSIVGKCVPNTPGNTFMCTEREFGNLLKIKDNHRKIVVSMDEPSGGNVEGVEHIHLREFLSTKY